jgi:hypothetical protein
MEKRKPFIIFVILLLMVLTTSCQIATTGEKTEVETEQSTILKTLSTPKARQRTDFAFLEKGMRYKEIVTHLGEADKDIGSGIYIFEYGLSDGSKIYLHFISLERLEMAAIKFPDGKEENLLYPNDISFIEIITV